MHSVATEKTATTSTITTLYTADHMNKVYFNDDDDDDGDQVSTKKKKSEMGICLPVSALNSFGYMVCYKRYCV